MIANRSLYVLVTLLAWIPLFGQTTIYFEDFNGYDGKGAVGPNPTMDVSGVSWQIDISAANLTADTDWFKVSNNLFEARDIDGICIWYSPSVDISAYSDVSISLIASELGTSENDDFIKSEFRLDGGSWTGFNTNSDLIGDFGNATATQTDLSASTLEIRVSFYNNAGAEFHRIDDVLIEGISTATTPSLTISPNSLSNFEYYLGNGPSEVQNFRVNGTNLTSEVILVAPENYEISISSESNFTNTINLTPSSGTISSTMIYCRLMEGLNINDYSGNLTISSSAATTRNLTLSGAVLMPLADVVITEIMYNSSGVDDEWIEICNLTGIDQNISNYQISVGNRILFAFPNNVVINENTCITIMLGSDGDSVFNKDCPFTPDFGNAVTTDNLVNSSETIRLLASDLETVIDLVTYSDSNGADGYGPSLHLIYPDTDNSSTSFNWQEVRNGGSPGILSLDSPCSLPELQLKNSSGSIQTCGDFALNFGAQAVAYHTDLSFKIENDGTADLAISSIDVSSVFSILDQSFPLNIPALSSVVITVRYSPSSNGMVNSILTIHSNDLDNASCTINLNGEGYTPIAKINVEGDVGTFPDIANGDVTPSGTDNTLFAAQYIGSSQTKSYRITNEGTALLEISNITITGANGADFEVTLSPETSIIPGEQTSFEITFTPSNVGVRNAVVTIQNNDTNNDPFTFAIRGEGLCVSNSNSLSPSTGPNGTIVTITGTSLQDATVSMAGIMLSANYLSDTQIEVTIPEDAVTSNITITTRSGCTSYKLFTVFTSKKSGCDGGSFLNELFISEITDATYGSLTYIEVFNPTSSTINLSSYSISIYPNGKTVYDDGYHQPLSGSLGSKQTYVITTGTSGLLGNSLCSVPGGNGSYGNMISSELPGINKVDLKHDFIGLYKSANIIDSFGLFGGIDWMDHLHTPITGDRGFNFKRLNSATTLPSTTFNDKDWFIIDWVGSKTSSCINNDYSDIGKHDFSTAPLPKITAQPMVPNSECDLTATISLQGVEGVAGGNTLAYQWFYNAPNSDVWVQITSTNSNHSGQLTQELTIADTFALNGYQYFAQLREDNESCFVASQAVRLKINKTVWNGSDWSDNIPDNGRIAILNNDYNTKNHGSFSACQLLVENSATLTIADLTYVEIVNDVRVKGSSTASPGNIIVETSGSFVQVNDAANVSLLGTGTIVVEKITAPMINSYEYTYWSSPVSYEEIDDALAEASPHRRFYFNAQNYRDSYAESNNNNATEIGHDDIDDNGDDWTFAGGQIMQAGVGYVSTQNPEAFNGNGAPPYSFKYRFEGAFHNGLIKVPIYRNDAETNDRNWNLIGNPYPSAIDAIEFLKLNPNLGGAIYLWSQGTPPSGSFNGNEALNFSQSDYAVINGSGSTSSGGGTDKPNGFVPSGQGFFVEYINSGQVITASGNIKQGEVVFRNNLRSSGRNSNEQFFRQRRNETVNKLWINLSTESGVFNQILIAYIDGATNENDGGFYDAKRNNAVNSFASLNSLIPSEVNEKFVIQGKNSSDLSLEDETDLAFSSSLESTTQFQIALDDLQGAFLTGNPIYLFDSYYGSYHDLKVGPYIFQSDGGEFNNRF